MMMASLLLSRLPILLLLVLLHVPRVASTQEPGCRGFQEAGRCFDSGTPMTQALSEEIGSAVSASEDLAKSIYEQ